jgi:hypothetical protein
MAKRKDDGFVKVIYTNEKGQTRYKHVRRDNHENLLSAYEAGGIAAEDEAFVTFDEQLQATREVTVEDIRRDRQLRGDRVVREGNGEPVRIPFRDSDDFYVRFFEAQGFALESHAYPVENSLNGIRPRALLSRGDEQLLLLSRGSSPNWVILNKQRVFEQPIRRGYPLHERELGKKGDLAAFLRREGLVRQEDVDRELARWNSWARRQGEYAHMGCPPPGPARTDAIALDPQARALAANETEVAPQRPGDKVLEAFLRGQGYEPVGPLGDEGHLFEGTSEALGADSEFEYVAVRSLEDGRALIKPISGAEVENYRAVGEVLNFDDIPAASRPLEALFEKQGLASGEELQVELLGWRRWVESPPGLPPPLSIQQRYARGLPRAEQELELATAFADRLRDQGFAFLETIDGVCLYQRAAAGRPSEVLAWHLSTHDGQPRYARLPAHQEARAYAQEVVQARSGASTELASFREGDFAAFLRTENLSLELLPSGFSQLALPFEDTAPSRSLDLALERGRAVAQIDHNPTAPIGPDEWPVREFLSAQGFLQAGVGEDGSRLFIREAPGVVLAPPFDNICPGEYLVVSAEDTSKVVFKRLSLSDVAEHLGPEFGSEKEATPWRLDTFATAAGDLEALLIDQGLERPFDVAGEAFAWETWQRLRASEHLPPLPGIRRQLREGEYLDANPVRASDQLSLALEFSEQLRADGFAFYDTLTAGRFDDQPVFHNPALGVYVTWHFGSEDRAGQPVWKTVTADELAAGVPYHLLRGDERVPGALQSLAIELAPHHGLPVPELPLEPWNLDRAYSDEPGLDLSSDAAQAVLLENASPEKTVAPELVSSAHQPATLSESVLGAAALPHAHGAEAAIERLDVARAEQFDSIAFPEATPVARTGFILFGPEWAATRRGHVQRVVIWAEGAQRAEALYFFGPLSAAVDGLRPGDVVDVVGLSSARFGIAPTTLRIGGSAEGHELPAHFIFPSAEELQERFSGPSRSRSNTLPGMHSFRDALAQSPVRVAHSNALEDSELAIVVERLGAIGVARAGRDHIRQAFDNVDTYLPAALATGLSDAAREAGKARDFTFDWPAVLLDRRFEGLASPADDGPLAGLGIEKATFDARPFKDAFRQEGAGLAVRTVDSAGTTNGIHFLVAQTREFAEAMAPAAGSPGLWASRPPEGRCREVVVSNNPASLLAYYQAHPSDDALYVATCSRAGMLDDASLSRLQALVGPLVGPSAAQMEAGLRPPPVRVIVLAEHGSSGRGLHEQVKTAFPELSVSALLPPLAAAHPRARSWLDHSRSNAFPEQVANFPAYARSRLGCEEVYRTPDGKDVVLSVPSVALRTSADGVTAPSADVVLFRCAPDGSWQFQGASPGDRGDALAFAATRMGLTASETRQDLRQFLLERALIDRTQPLARASNELAAAGIHPSTLDDPCFRGSLRALAEQKDRALVFPLQNGIGFCGVWTEALSGSEPPSVGGTAGIWASAKAPSVLPLSRIVIVQHPREALAYHQQNPPALVEWAGRRIRGGERVPEAVQYVACSDLSSKVQREALQAVLSHATAQRSGAGPELVVACSNDKTGRDFMDQVQRVLPYEQLAHRAPSVGRSWSDSVVRREREFIRAAAGHADGRAGGAGLGYGF